MRLLGQTLFAGTAVALAFALTPACVDNDQSIFIRQVQAGSAAASGTTGCSYIADPSTPGLIEGVVDTALRDNYQAVLLVGSQLIQRGDSTQPRAESNRSHLDGAIVRITDADGNDISEFTAQSTGFVDNSLAALPSYGLMGVTLLDAPTLAKAAGGLTPGQTKLVLANIKAFGETLGGVDLESGEFQFAIRICNGCLISFLDQDDTGTPGIDCNRTAAAGATGGTAGGGTGGGTAPCYPGQDGVISCALCKDTNCRCQSLIPAPGCNN